MNAAKARLWPRLFYSNLMSQQKRHPVYFIFFLAKLSGARKKLESRDGIS